MALIRTYQRTASPALSVFYGGGGGCRFVPSCSEYAAEAVQTRGALAGAWLAVRRLARCTPFRRGGFDPVPALDKSRRSRPRCLRVA